MSINTQKMVTDYIEFVQGSIHKFSKIGDLAQEGEVPPEKVFYAMSMYYDTCLALNAEYQRLSIEKTAIELEYDAAYAEWFQECKAELVAENSSKSAKPALKEIEQLIKAQYKDEYFSYQQRIAEADSKCSFFIRLRETLNKYDGILTNLAMSLRSELRALNIENRANAREKFAPMR